MNTPICDFVKKYRESKVMRLHMPGHKGNKILGAETLDITEIDGADVLYSAHGIILESEKNASLLFGTKKTLYSCEGSSLAIRAMLYLARLCAPNSSNVILAARNAHKVFISAVALLGLDVEWLYDENSNNIISCKVSPDQLRKKLQEMKEKPIAFYITSPDYLGNIADIEGLAQVCKEENILLICDNAHGAYLNFTEEALHPISLGAHMCCDSAHKTLPVLTGGAYLHIGKDAPDTLCENAERAMALFASTSPSYLILQSLDNANTYLSHGYREKLKECIAKGKKLKSELYQKGFDLIGNEGLKITLAPKSYGYTGTELAEYLSSCNIICEFSDPDYTVLMFNTENDDSIFEALEKALLNLPKKASINDSPPAFEIPKRKISSREAIFSESEKTPVNHSLGKILATETVSCPPAIPVVVCGEVINESAVELFNYYNIETVITVK